MYTHFRSHTYLKCDGFFKMLLRSKHRSADLRLGHRSVHVRQCCGSGMIIPDPGSRIPDPKTAIKGRSEKKFVVIPFFVAINFTNCKLFYFWNAEEKNLGQFSNN
jgi:hypothetical protein